MIFDGELLSALLKTPGYTAAVLQVIGYGLYLRYAFRKEIKPNPLTWLMFAYGTTLLFWLEFDRDASWLILFLPMACAASSLVVVALCYLRGGYEKKIDPVDKLMFAFDLVLTALYLAVWGLLAYGYIDEAAKDSANFIIIVAWVFGIGTAFTPMAREVRSKPSSEHPLPWIIWSCAYAMLIAATLIDEGVSVFLLYPIVALIFHALIAKLSYGGLRDELKAAGL